MTSGLTLRCSTPVSRRTSNERRSRPIPQHHYWIEPVFDCTGEEEVGQPSSDIETHRCERTAHLSGRRRKLRCKPEEASRMRRLATSHELGHDRWVEDHGTDHGPPVKGLVAEVRVLLHRLPYDRHLGRDQVDGSQRTLELVGVHSRKVETQRHRDVVQQGEAGRPRADAELEWCVTATPTLQCSRPVLGSLRDLRRNVRWDEDRRRLEHRSLLRRYHAADGVRVSPQQRSRPDVGRLDLMPAARSNQRTVLGFSSTYL